MSQLSARVPEYSKISPDNMSFYTDEEITHFNRISQEKLYDIIFYGVAAI